MSGPWEQFAQSESVKPWEKFAENRTNNAKPVAASIGDQLRQMPRQIGLTARYGLEGAADTAGILTEPIRLGLQSIGVPTASTRGMVSGALDSLGFPSPQGPDERVIADASRMVAGAGGLVKGSQLASAALTGPITRTVTNALSQNAGQQAVSAATAGAAGGSVRESGGGPLEQFGASLLGGLGGAGAAGAVVKVYEGISSAIKNLLTPKSTMFQVDVVINQILQQNGYDVSKIPGAVRTSMAAEVKRALDTGNNLNPDAIRRLADYGVVGATPTRGTVTLDPATITQEQNLAKAGMNSQDQRLQVLGNVKNSNNRVMIGNLNDLGGATPNADPLVAGSKVVGGVASRDAAAKVVEKTLYDRARDSTGRSLDLDREGFISDAYNRLGQSNKGAFLPEGIKSILEQIRAGKARLLDGSEIDTPFNVDVIDNLKTILSKASRSTQDGNVKAAIAEVRNALESSQPVGVGRPVGGNQVADPALLSAAQTRANDSGAAAMRAFDEARAFARNRRNWQESAPAIKAALDGVPPDRFIKDYIIGNTGKSSTRDVEALINDFHGDPAGLQAIKEHVVWYLKNKALGGASDEVGNFSQSGYNNALNAIGDAKLRLLFGADEIVKLKALGRVASYEMVQPKGSAVNNSNTGGAVAGLLDRIANSSLIGRVPFGDAALKTPARNWSTQIGVNNALNTGTALSTAAMRPQKQQLPNGLAALLLSASPSVESRDNQKRR